MNEVILQKLIAYGFSDKEARVYVALLELGPATAFRVARTADVNRSSAYVILDALRVRGLVGVSKDKKVQRFMASSPDILLEAAEEAAKKQEEVKQGIESIMPDLKFLGKETKGRPTVRVFEGRNGIKEVFYDCLSDGSASDLRTYADASKLYKIFPGFIEFNKKRVAKGINMYAINPAKKEVLDILKAHPLSGGDQMLLIPLDKFRFPVNIGIYGNKIYFISKAEEMAILIESKDIAETYRNSFDLSWAEAKRLDKEVREKEGIDV